MERKQQQNVFITHRDWTEEEIEGHRAMKEEHFDLDVEAEIEEENKRKVNRWTNR